MCSLATRNRGILISSRPYIYRNVTTLMPKKHADYVFGALCQQAQGRYRFRYYIAAFTPLWYLRCALPQSRSIAFPARQAPSTDGLPNGRKSLEKIRGRRSPRDLTWPRLRTHTPTPPPPQTPRVHTATTTIPVGP